MGLCHYAGQGAVQPGMNNVLDYGLDRVTNPNEVQVNQLSFSCLHSGCCGVLRRIKNCNSHAGAPSPQPAPASVSDPAVRGTEAGAVLDLFATFTTVD